MGEERKGYLYGFVAYVLWGFFPIYFKLLQPASPFEILAQRILWSLAFVALLLVAIRGWGFVRRLRRDRRMTGGIALAGLLIGVNWATYIIGVNSDRVVETALGYFITPLVMVLLGVTVERERLRVWQWVAIAVGAAAVVVLTVDYGHLPYIALLLAASFGSYGLIKKRISLRPAEGLFLESAVLALPAFAFLTWLNLRGGAEFGHVSGTHTALMVLSGVATAIPLLLFAGAANRVPMAGLGILQYVAPVIQLAVGVLLFHEPMPPARLAGFVLVWIALVVFTADALFTARRKNREKNRAKNHEHNRKQNRDKNGEEIQGKGRRKAGDKRRAAAEPTAATADPAATLSPR